MAAQWKAADLQFNKSLKRPVVTKKNEAKSKAEKGHKAETTCCTLVGV